jgi:hypothetical protein
MKLDKVEETGCISTIAHRMDIYIYIYIYITLHFIFNVEAIPSAGISQA